MNLLCLDLINKLQKYENEVAVMQCGVHGCLELGKLISHSLPQSKSFLLPRLSLSGTHTM